MSNFMNFSSDRPLICLILIDKSGSMRDDQRYVVAGINAFGEKFKNFPEANSIAVSICQFDDEFYANPFEPVTNINFSYYPNGGTALYYSIVKASKYLKDYSQEVTNVTGIVPRATFIVLSDGHPEGDKMTRSDAVKVIEELNYSGVTTVFAALGNAIESKFGEAMGFLSTTDVRTGKNLADFLGEELSNSIKRQSVSLKALGSNFFSKAVGKTESEGFSQTTQQALEDTSWIDDI